MLNPFSSTLFLDVAIMSLYQNVQRHTGLTHTFNFLTFGHSGAQSCPNVKKLKMEGWTSMSLNTLKSNYLTPLGLKWLISRFFWEQRPQTRCCGCLTPCETLASPLTVILQYCANKVFFVTLCGLFVVCV